ncbi:hypothetical protein AgCh_009267 [Apium graveolens]
MVYKARYFPHNSIFEAQKGRNPSFIWQGLVTALNSLHTWFIWVVGNSESIYATRDQWLRSKKDFCVVDDHIYAARTERVSTYIDVENASLWLLDMLPNARSKDINKVIVLWGNWVWWNKKVWEAKITTAIIAMDHSFNHVAEWRVARSKNKEGPHLNLQQSTTYAHKWRLPADGVLKVNVDAFYRSGSGTFFIGNGA